MPVTDLFSQDAKTAEYMSVNVSQFCGVFKFLEQLLHARHPMPFFRLLTSVAYEDVKASFLIKSKMLFYDREPMTANGSI